MDELKKIALQIRKTAIESIYHARSGHPGGCLSVADILAVLYFDQMKVDASDPDAEQRDRLVLSKGHACPALYAALALKGFFPVEETKGLRKIDHFLEGHPEINIPGVDAPSGSLGMGLSQGLGMAFGARYSGKPFHTYVILGDGDMQEGNTWEAFMCAAHHKVGSLTAILDANGLQGDATVEVQMNYEPIRPKLEAFGWKVLEVDGHDLHQLKSALEEARSQTEQPVFILARTLKGKGVGYMENEQVWHGSSTLTDEQLTRALEALED